ncbi:MAG: aspartate/glutamate racemase family protein, partial [Nitrososphaerota archaeon]
MVRIFVLNPVSTSIWNRITEKTLKKIAFKDTELSVGNLDDGPRSIESDSDVVLAAPRVVEKVLEAEGKGYDAAVINCFDDPGLEAAREKASILVLGVGETSMLTALHLGYRFAVI